jgi:hypothetical protein
LAWSYMTMIEPQPYASLDLSGAIIRVVVDVSETSLFPFCMYTI